MLDLDRIRGQVAANAVPADVADLLAEVERLTAESAMYEKGMDGADFEANAIAAERDVLKKLNEAVPIEQLIVETECLRAALREAQGYVFAARTDDGSPADILWKRIAALLAETTR